MIAMRPKLMVGLGLCVALAAGCRRTQPARLDAARTLTVMSFNLRYATANDGPDSWPYRREQLFALLRRHDADLIGVQEALYDQLGEVRAAVSGFAMIGVGRDDGREAGEYAAILYRADRFDVLDSGTFWFSDTPAVPGSRSWGNTVTRICTWARLRHRPSGRAIFVFNVHLDHQSQPSRERSVALLLERIRARGTDDPVLVTGDFNAGETNPAARAMVAGGFRDSYRVAHPADTLVGTFNGFRGTANGEKIDFVFVSDGWGVTDAAIDRSSVEGRYPSDHFPVTARLLLPGTARPRR